MVSYFCEPFQGALAREVALGATAHSIEAGAPAGRQALCTVDGQQVECFPNFPESSFYALLRTQ